MTVRIDLPADPVTNGDELRGQAHWQSAGKQPRSIVVRCRWRVEGKRCNYEHIIDEHVEQEIGARTEMAIPFHFKIPLEGPLSYHGKLFDIVWDIVVRVGPFASVAPWNSEQETKLFTVKARRYDPAEYDDPEDDEDDADTLDR